MDRATIRDAYDRSAAGYDARFWALQEPKYRAVLSAIPLRPGCRILDLGAGTGLLSRCLNRRFVALDLSRQMIERAPASLWRLQADSDHLPFAEQSFDAVLSFTALLQTPHLGPTFAEVHRVLSPGGLFALTLLHGDRFAGLETLLQQYGLRPFRELLCGQDFAILCFAGG